MHTRSAGSSWGHTQGVREGPGHGHPPLSPSTLGRNEGTTQPGDVGILMHEQHQLLHVDEEAAAREAAEEDDDGGTLQDHPHPQQVLAAIGLQGERAASEISWAKGERGAALTTLKTSWEGFGARISLLGDC